MGTSSTNGRADQGRDRARTDGRRRARTASGPEARGRRIARVGLGVVTAAAGALVLGAAQVPSASQAATATPSAATTIATTSTAMPTGDVTDNGRTWHQVHDEDFTTPAPLGTVLSRYPALAAYDGQHDTSGRGVYAPGKVLSVEHGDLDFWLHSEGGQPLVASVLPDGYTSQTTGRVSIRYTTTATPGYKFVGMYWPSDDDWDEGEIDWPEGDLGSTVRPASAIPGTYRDGAMTFDHAVETPSRSTQSSGYHVVTTEWDHGIVRFYRDGVLVSATRKAVPTTPMRVTLQAETAITGAVPASSSGHVDVDWVAIWR